MAAAGQQQVAGLPGAHVQLTLRTAQPRACSSLHRKGVLASCTLPLVISSPMMMMAAEALRAEGTCAEMSLLLLLLDDCLPARSSLPSASMWAGAKVPSASFRALQQAGGDVLEMFWKLSVHCCCRLMKQKCAQLLAAAACCHAMCRHVHLLVQHACVDVVMVKQGCVQVIGGYGSSPTCWAAC